MYVTYTIQVEALIHVLIQVETRVRDVNVIYLAVVGEQDDVRVQGFGFRVSGFGFRVQGSGFRVQGLRLRVEGHEPASRWRGK